MSTRLVSPKRVVAYSPLVLLIIAMVFLPACSRAPVKSESPAGQAESPSTSSSATPVTPSSMPLAVSSEGKSPLFAKPLTGSGDNSDGRYSPDGERIVFVSRLRSNHKQAQVYELHLGRMTEKRLTYHDGDDSGPLYTADSAKLLFSSSTDEIKSPQFAVQRLMKNYAPNLASKNASSEPGFELYEQTLHGRAIERLSHSPGFDGDADFDRKTQRMVFSSSRASEGTHLFLQNGKHVQRLTDGKVIDRGARFSADGATLVWSRQELQAGSQPSNEARLMLAGGNFRSPRALLESRALHIQPTWHPSGTEIVFSSNIAGKAFNLFLIDVAGKCLRRLTTTDVDQLQPAFSPDGKRLLFTAMGNSRQQIFVMDFAPPTECWQPAPPLPMPTPTQVPASSS